MTLPRLVASTVVSILFLSQGHASTNTVICNASREKPCIVEDTTRQITVKNLRDTKMIMEAWSGNIKGISELKASGSSAPGIEGWQQVGDYILSRSGIHPDHVLVLDLRQENHAYLNGQAITLCDKYNWLNLGYTLEQIKLMESEWISDLASYKEIDNVLSHKQFKNGEFSQGKTKCVHSLMNEKEMVRQFGFNYVRIPVSDHRAALDHEVDQFVALINKLPADGWLHIHCRGGVGRTTSFLAMYDMLKNADKASFDDIIKRQASIPPFVNLSVISHNDTELTPYYEARLQFLKHFYQYASDRLAGYTGSWSRWKSEHKSQWR